MGVSPTMLSGGLSVCLVIAAAPQVPRSVAPLCPRHQEIAADLYAIDLTGDIDGATELMHLYIAARPKTRRGGSLLRTREGYFETLPAPETWLEAMRRHLTAR
jgi:hypothetical protein